MPILTSRTLRPDGPGHVWYPCGAVYGSAAGPHQFLRLPGEAVQSGVGGTGSRYQGVDRLDDLSLGSLEPSTGSQGPKYGVGLVL